MAEGLNPSPEDVYADYKNKHRDAEKASEELDREQQRAGKGTGVESLEDPRVLDAAAEADTAEDKEFMALDSAEIYARENADKLAEQAKAEMEAEKGGDSEK